MFNMMDDCCAPQWIDFTSSPQLPSEDYFEKEHTIHKPKIVESLDDTIYHEVSENLSMELKYLDDKREINLDNIIKKTPVTVVLSSSKRNNKQKTTETTYDNILSEAVKNWQLSGKLAKSTKHALNMSSSIASKDIFKTPNIPPNKMSNIVDSHATLNDSIFSVSTEKSDKLKKSSDTVETDNTLITTKNSKKNFHNENRNENDSLSSNLHRVNEKLFSESKPTVQEPQKQARSINSIPINRRSKVLTSQFRRHSIKCSKRSNQYISLAEAIRKFQNDTPKRFHSVNKNTTKCTAKLKEPLKVTIPRAGIKNFKSHSQEEQGTVKSKEMENLKLKSNSVQLRATKSVSSLPKTTKEVAVESLQSTQKKKPSQSVATIVNTNNGEIVVKKEEVLFFGIPTNTNRRKVTHPVPFSFETRDKLIATKKKERFEQALEESKKLRTFHANPVPTFKPVIVHGLSKENLTAKEKSTNGPKKVIPFHRRSNFDKKTKQSKSVNSNNCSENKSKNEKNDENVECDKNINQENEEPNIMTSNASTVTVYSNTEKKKETVLKPLPLELNTDKRAKERREFEERIRQKKKEEEEKLKKEREEKLAMEKIENAELRKKMQIKANPMPVYKPLLRIKSKKPLTDPQSPGWLNKKFH